MGLIVKIGADTNAFKRAMSGITRDVNSLGSTLQNAGKSMTMKTTLPITGMLGAAVKIGQEFEFTMAKVKAISGATGEEFKALQAKAEEMGAQTMFSASEVAQGFTYMGMAGWKTNDMLAGIEPTLKLAIATATDLGTTTDIVTDQLTAFGLTANDTQRFVDIFAATVTNSNTDVIKMGDTLKYAGTVAGTLGYNIEDVSLAIGLMANQNVKASQAGTSLRRIMTEIQGGVDLVTKSTKKWHIETQNADGTNRRLKDVLVDMRKAFGDMTESQKAMNAETIAGKTGMTGLLAIMNSTESDFNKLSKAIDNSAGSVQEMEAIMMDTTQGSIDEMKSAIEGSLIRVFEAISPVVTDVANGVGKLANAFSELSPSTQRFIVGALGVTALIGPFMSLTGTVIKLGGKIKAIPVAMSKINGKSIERQVNAWLRWNNVSEGQAAKLRAIARDMDKVKRGGEQATTSTKRLKKELIAIKVNNKAPVDINKIKTSLEGAKGSARQLNKELKLVRPTKKVVTGVVPSITNSDRSRVRSIGSTLAQDLVSTFSTQVGALGGTAGMIFGDVIGDAAGSALATSISTGGFKTVITGTMAGLGKFALSALPLVGVFAAVGLGLKKLTDEAKKTEAGVSSISGGFTKSGQEIKGMSAETQKALQPVLDKMTKIDEKTGKKVLDVTVKYTEEVDKASADVFTQSQEKFKERLKNLQQNNQAYANEMKKVNEQIKKDYNMYTQDIMEAETALANGKITENERVQVAMQANVAKTQMLQQQELAQMIANGATLSDINNKKLEQEATLNSERNRFFQEELKRGQQELFNKKDMAKQALDAKLQAIEEEYKAQQTAIYKNEALTEEQRNMQLENARLAKEKKVALAKSEAAEVGNAVDNQIENYKRLVDEMVASGAITEQEANKIKQSLDSLKDKEVITIAVDADTQMARTQFEAMGQARSQIEKPMKLSVQDQALIEAKKKANDLESDIKKVDALEPSVDVKNNFDSAKNKANDLNSAIKNITPEKSVVIRINEITTKSTVTSGGKPKNEATGGQLASGLTIVGRLLPTLNSVKSVPTALTPHPSESIVV